MNLVDAAILAAGLGASGWCVWHRVRGVRAVREGRARCCPPAGATTAAWLAELHGEVRALHQALEPGTPAGVVSAPR